MAQHFAETLALSPLIYVMGSASRWKIEQLLAIAALPERIVELSLIEVRPSFMSVK
jgi:hypothetical protein